MSRSVSYPHDTAALVFTSFEHKDAARDSDCQLGVCECWGDFIDNLTSSMHAAFPSLDHTDTWTSREDHAILANAHCYVGISEYCGLVSVWAILRPDILDAASDEEFAEARIWCDTLDAGAFANAVRAANGEILRKVGTFSNGESVYERV